MVPAAGRGLRMGRSEPKQFLEVSGKPLIAHTIDRLCESDLLSGITVVVPGDFLDHAEKMLKSYCDLSRFAVTVIAGGKERQDSVFKALQILPAECEWVLIHDGVRPFVSTRLLEETCNAARESGAAIAAMSATDTVKRVCDGSVIETLPREEIRLVQTPQVFRKDLIFAAYLEAQERGWSVTDDAALLERIHIDVHVVEGERTNIKVTTSSDLEWAAWFLDRQRDRQQEAARDSGADQCE